MNDTLKGTCGFTLVELMVAVAMLALVAGIAVPAMNLFVINVKTKSAAREIHDMLQHARILAAKEGCNALVTFGDPTNAAVDFTVVTVGVDLDGNDALNNQDAGGNALDELKITYTLQGSVKGKREEEADRVVIFNPRGSLQSGAGSWTVFNTETDRAYTLSVSPLGTVAMKNKA